MCSLQHSARLPRWLRWWHGRRRPSREERALSGAGYVAWRRTASSTPATPSARPAPSLPTAASTCASRASPPTAPSPPSRSNITAVDPTATSYVTVWPAGTPRPDTSNLNLNPGTDTPTLVIATLGVDHTISLYNYSGTTHLLADVAGYFTTAGDYRALRPDRLLDTRNAIGSSGPVGPDSSIDVRVAGRGAFPATAA